MRIVCDAGHSGVMGGIGKMKRTLTQYQKGMLMGAASMLAGNGIGFLIGLILRYFGG